MNPELDLLRLLEDTTRRLRRDLQQEQDDRRALEVRVARAEARLTQVESDVKDAHDRLDGVSADAGSLKDGPEPFGLDESLDEIDERELGESGA